jgi:two-component system CheB/CheR fusion protein
MVDVDPEFEELLAFLKETRGFDFTGYKRSSLMRRVRRRMETAGIDTFADYVDHLQVHQDEYTALFNTILINVTGFLRDPDAWAYLREHVLPELVATRPSSAPIRVWSAGCASGEEAYTVAMLIAEAMGPEVFHNGGGVKIYATDVDEEALAKARAAAYTERDVEPIPDDLRAKYFDVQAGRHIFNKELRRAIIFGRNDLVQDAPIGRIDLLICRNTLMYFNAETQSRVLRRFNFALNEHGLLFLGKAEMLLSYGDLFTPIDLKRRIFRKVHGPNQVAGPFPNGVGRAVPDDPPPADDINREVLGAVPVATLAVTADDRFAYSNARADAMFATSRRDLGRPFRDLDVSYRPSELRPSIELARSERRPVWLRDVEWPHGAGEVTWFDVQVTPIISAQGVDLGAAVYFHDVTRQHQLKAELDYANRQLETAYEELQSTVEELETTNEELQSTVEELETTNEELQSTNEELETMNEELQSTNDELQSINDELRDRTNELNETNAFLQAIMGSVRSAVVVVDRDLVVRAWNRRAEDLWGVRADEAVSHHLLNLDIGIATDRLRPLIRPVLTDGADSEEATFDGINRRGRPVTINVVCSGLRLFDQDVSGAILLMSEVDGAGA